MTRSAWSPQQGPRWTLADGLGLTSLVVLTFAWASGGDPTAFSAAITLTGALACLPYAIRRWRWAPPGLAWWPIGAALLLLAWGVISGMGSGAPWPVSIYGWFGRSDGLLTLVAVICLLLSAASLAKEELDRLVTWLLAAGAVLIVEAMGQLAGATYPPGSQYAGVSAALGNPNFFAAASAMLAVLALGRVLDPDKRPWQRWAAAALVLGLTACSVLSQSVQGPVALVIGLVGGGIAWSLHHRGRGRALGLALSAGVIAAGLAGVVLVALQVGPFAAVRAAQTIGYREAYWEAAWRMMAGLPIFGAGPDSFARHVASFRTENYLAAPGSQIRVSAAHDIPLQYGATFGVVGLFAWLALMVGTAVVVARGLLRGVTHVWLAASIVGAWIAYLAQAMISIDAPGLKSLGWVVTGLAIAVGVQRARPPGSPAWWMPWLSGTLGLLAVLLWWPGISATNSALDQRTLDGALSDASNPLVPCPVRQQILTQLTRSVQPDSLLPVAQKTFDLDPRCAPLAPLVAEIALNAEDTDLALEAAKAAVSTDPLAPGSWLALSLVERRTGDPKAADEALAEARRLAAIDPSDNLDEALSQPSAAP